MLTMAAVSKCAWVQYQVTYVRMLLFKSMLTVLVKCAGLYTRPPDANKPSCRLQALMQTYCTSLNLPSYLPGCLSFSGVGVMYLYLLWDNLQLQSCCCTVYGCSHVLVGCFRSGYTWEHVVQKSLKPAPPQSTWSRAFNKLVGTLHNLHVRVTA